nr:xyloglucan endotransglucosylase/hydrolase protein 24-like [Ipomoea batatas]
MAYPTRHSSSSSHSRSSGSNIACLSFLFLTAFFVFKIDILIVQKLSRAWHGTEHIAINQIEVHEPKSPESPFKLGNGSFHREFLLSWGDHHCKILEDGELLTLELDRSSGAGFESKKIEVLELDGDHHDEIDFEFLGNSSGNPYTLHTNVFSQGRGDREVQFFLWFDPTADFHTYTILWNPKSIIFYVDGTPIREFRNAEKIGVPFPKDQPMRLYSSIWNADSWATQGGRVKTNWTLAPFVAAYRNFSAEGCVWSRPGRSSSCNFDDDAALTAQNSWFNTELNRWTRARMRTIQRRHMVYNYCTDKWRFRRRGPGRELAATARMESFMELLTPHGRSNGVQRGPLVTKRSRFDAVVRRFQTAADALRVTQQTPSHPAVQEINALEEERKRLLENKDGSRGNAAAQDSVNVFWWNGDIEEMGREELGAFMAALEALKANVILKARDRVIAERLENIEEGNKIGYSDLLLPRKVWCGPKPKYVNQRVDIGIGHVGRSCWLGMSLEDVLRSSKVNQRLLKEVEVKLVLSTRVGHDLSSAIEVNIGSGIRDDAWSSYG